MARTDPPLERLEEALASEVAPATCSENWVEAWRARVHGMALALTRDPTAAEDLGQEVFLRALKAASRPEGEALGSWLYRIARNAWIDGVRSRARDGRGAQGAQGAPSLPVERLAARVEPMLDEPPVLVAWKALPEDERLVVWLRLMLDVPFREIAQLRDMGRIRAGLAQLDVRPAGAAERTRRGPAREDRRGGSRVLSWWTVSVGLAAVVIVGFLAGRALRNEPEGPPSAEQAAGKGPWSHFRDVADVVARADAPRVVQFRIEADGETRLRWRVRGPDSDWEARGPWSLTLADPEAAYAALRNLKEALLEASPERLKGAETRSEKSPRVVLDVDPVAPWRFVQWVVAVAAAYPNDLGRLTFLLDDDTASVDIDVPMDLTPEEFLQVQELGSVKLFRKEDPSEPTRAWTRIRWLQERTWDLPVGAPEVEAGMFAELENTIVAAIKQAAPVAPVAIEIKAPPPTGGLVPTGDVLRVVTTLRRAGVATILFEGAPPPSGRGWNLLPQGK